MNNKVITVDVITKDMLLSFNKNGRKYKEDIIPRGEVNIPFVISDNNQSELQLDEIAGYVTNITDTRATLKIADTPKGKVVQECIVSLGDDFVQTYCMYPIGLGKLNNGEIYDYTFLYFKLLPKENSNYVWDVADNP